MRHPFPNHKLASSGNKRHGYWGNSVIDLITGKTDAHLRELKRHRILSASSNAIASYRKDLSRQMSDYPLLSPTSTS